MILEVVHSQVYHNISMKFDEHPWHLLKTVQAAVPSLRFCATSEHSSEDYARLKEAPSGGNLWNMWIHVAQSCTIYGTFQMLHGLTYVDLC